MDWDEPAAVVMTHGTAAVLRTLAGTDEAFSVRDLARLAGVSPTRTRHVVNRLAEHGLVTMDSSPSSHLIRLNRDHLATEPAIELANLRGRVIDRLRSEVASWSRPALHASLFGSAARGDGSIHSDIDLLVVHGAITSQNAQEAWDDQLARSGEAILRWTGNWVSWFQVSDTDLIRMTADREPIVAEWRREAVPFFGPPLTAFLGRAS